MRSLEFKTNQHYFHHLPSKSQFESGCIFKMLDNMLIVIVFLRINFDLSLYLTDEILRLTSKDVQTIM